MRPTLPALVRVLNRSEVAAATIKPLPRPLRSDTIRAAKVTLIQELQAEKARLGEEYPSNIRIEPPLDRKVLKDVQPQIRSDFLKLMKEK